MVFPSRQRTAPPPSLWQDVLTHFNDAVVVMDEATRIVLFNQAAEELIGVPQRRVLGRPCADIFQQTPLIATMVKRVEESRQGESRGEEQIQCRTKTVVARLTCLPLWGAGDRLSGIALVIQDLSYKKTLEEAARRNESLARLGTLVAGLAHEVRNPLAGIKGAAQLLKMRVGESEDLREYTDVICRETDRLSELVENLLTLGAPPRPRLERINIHRILRQVFAVLAPELSTRGVALEANFDPSLPDIDADPNQLSQVFLNVLKNAMDATNGKQFPPEAPPLVRVGTRIETDFHILQTQGGTKGSYLRVEISDQGEGIALADAGRAFEPFFTTKARGTGLGLAISHKIVSEHGGIIRFVRNPTAGTTVAISLPLPRN